MAAHARVVGQVINLGVPLASTGPARLALIPKASGGGRLILVVTSIYRLVNATMSFAARGCVRRGVSIVWGDAIKGCAAVRAALRRSILCEAARCSGQSATMILWVEEAFYYSFSPADVAQLGAAAGHPANLLALAIRPT